MILKQSVLIFLITVITAQSQTDTCTLCGKPAPLFRLPNQNSATPVQFNLADCFSNDSSHAVIVSFFAEWCVPCRAELPFLQKTADSLESSGLRMAAVCVDSAFGEKQKKMVSDTKLSCPVIHDKFGIVAKRYECGRALPYTVFIDRSGIVSAVSTGFDEKKKPLLFKHINQILR